MTRRPARLTADKIFDFPFFLTEEKLQGIMKIVNFIALTTAFLAFVFGPILYSLNGRLYILIPALTEGCLFLSVPILTYFGRWQSAIIVTFVTQVMATAYFGSLLGPVAQVQTLGIFLGGIALLMFSDIRMRAIALSTVLGLVIWLELNFRYGFIPPLDLTLTYQEFIRQCVLGTVLFLNSLMLYFYVRELRRSKQKVTEYTSQLEKARMAMSVYVRETSHEIRSPLNIVYGIVQTYLASLNRSEDKVSMEGHHLRALNVASHNVLEVINNVLEWSKVEAGKNDELHQEVIMLPHWLDELTALYRQLAEAREVQLTTVYVNMLPEKVRIDRSRLNSILSNLLSNAVKFTAAKSAVTLKASAEGNQLVFEVSDQGKGLSAEAQAHIFEPFVSTPNSFIKGTGLGLPIVREMVYNLGGTIIVDSRLGTGTTFTVKIPYQPADTANAAITVPATYEKFEGTSVMVVDDNAMNRMIAMMHLNRLGIRVLQAENAMQAASLAREAMPDIILLDLHMPEVDGRQLLHTLQQDPLVKGIRVIVTSGDVYKEVQDELLAAGASGFVSKPVIFEELYETLRKLVKGN